MVMVPNCKSETLTKIILEYIEPGTEIIIYFDFGSFGHNHLKVYHSIHLEGATDLSYTCRTLKIFGDGQKNICY
ncbi:hypothetical protein HZS_4340 [Henneguya salminicola]|nr:hypothetical protein HZS_4340 [Henneguya salminicola]